MIDPLMPFSDPAQFQRLYAIRDEIRPIHERLGIVPLANIAVEESTEN
jgi:hypothetical protein